MPTDLQPPPAPAPLPGNVRKADTSDYRDFIPTVDQRGKRVWMYPRQPKGRLYKYRSWLSYFLLVVLFTGPFIRINGNPLLMMNIVERKFSLFGLMFYPQDMFLFAIAMVAGFISIVLFTAVFGRVWCGWLCPQTVLMEMVFRKIEYFIEGDGSDQRALNKAPWTKQKITKKATKHAIFFGLSFVIGNLLLAYIIGSEALIAVITDPPSQHVAGLIFMVLFSLLFYGIFARFREQACTFICPYGRFQSVLLDEHSLVVAYDFERGNPHGRFSRKTPHDERKAAGTGDCIDCHLCVDVCPTGIDIRNGTQMECVNCTACIDACNGVMDKLQFPRGLIRVASLNGITKKEKFKFTTRDMVYCAVLVGLFAFLGIMLANRDPINATLLRGPGPLFQELPNGQISNLYMIRAVNKTSEPMDLTLRLLDPDGGTLTLPAGHLAVEAGGNAKSPTIIVLPRELLKDGSRHITVGLYQGDELMQEFSANFTGPGLGSKND